MYKLKQQVILIGELSAHCRIKCSMASGILPLSRKLVNSVKRFAHTINSWTRLKYLGSCTWCKWKLGDQTSHSNLSPQSSPSYDNIYLWKAFCGVVYWFMFPFSFFPAPFTFSGTDFCCPFPYIKSCSVRPLGHRWGWRRRRPQVSTLLLDFTRECYGQNVTKSKLILQLTRSNFSFHLNMELVFDPWSWL